VPYLIRLLDRRRQPPAQLNQASAQGSSRRASPRPSAGHWAASASARWCGS